MDGTVGVMSPSSGNDACGEIDLDQFEVLVVPSLFRTADEIINQGQGFGGGELSGSSAGSVEGGSSYGTGSSFKGGEVYHPLQLQMHNTNSNP